MGKESRRDGVMRREGGKKRVSKDQDGPTANGRDGGKRGKMCLSWCACEESVHETMDGESGELRWAVRIAAYFLCRILNLVYFIYTFYFVLQKCALG